MDKALPRVCVNSAGTTHCAPDWFLDFGEKQAWEDYDLWVVRGGSGTFATPARTFTLTAGDCFVLRPSERYVGQADPADPPIITHIHYDYMNARGRPRRPCPGVPRLHRRMVDLAFFGRLLDGVVLAARTHGPQHAEAALWLTTALVEVERQDARPRLSGPALAQATAIEALCAEIQANPGCTYSARDLAKRLHVTPHHFGRLFKRYCGVGPREFVVQARIAAAKGLLRHSSHTITRIADLLGYRDVYFFSKQFRARVGTSPSVFRGE